MAFKVRYSAVTGKGIGTRLHPAPCTLHTAPCTLQGHLYMYSRVVDLLRDSISNTCDIFRGLIFGSENLNLGALKGGHINTFTSHPGALILIFLVFP